MNYNYLICLHPIHIIYINYVTQHNHTHKPTHTSAVHQVEPGHPSINVDKRIPLMTVITINNTTHDG